MEIIEIKITKNKTFYFSNYLTPSHTLPNGGAGGGAPC
jgi:hypothetical protein